MLNIVFQHLGGRSSQYVSTVLFQSLAFRVGSEVRTFRNFVLVSGIVVPCSLCTALIAIRDSVIRSAPHKDAHPHLTRTLRRTTAQNGLVAVSLPATPCL